MLWIIKNYLQSILKKALFVGIYVYFLVFFENGKFSKLISEFLKEKEIVLSNQLIMYGGLFIYSAIIEKINLNINILPRINLEFILNKRHKIITCQFIESETRTNTKVIQVSYQKNLDNLVGKILKFINKFYFFILEIKYPKAVSLEFDFLDKNYGKESRKKSNEFVKELEENEYIHTKELYTYYINISKIGDNTEYENEYKCRIISKGKFTHSKIKSNLSLYSKNNLAKVFFPIIFILFLIFINFKPINVGITSEGGE